MAMRNSVYFLIYLCIFYKSVGKMRKERKQILIHENTHLITRVPTTEWQSPLNPNLTVLSTDKLPSDIRLLPTIGNGHVATVVKNDFMFMNGLYNGYNITSHRAKIPAIFVHNYSMQNEPDIKPTKYILDMANGIYSEKLSVDSIAIELTFYAHRAIKQLLVTELIVRNSRINSISLALHTPNISSTEDIVLNYIKDGYIGLMSGKTREWEYKETGIQHISIVFSIIPDYIEVPPLQEHRILFLVSVDQDPMVAKKQFDLGQAMFFDQTLQSSHVKAWTDIWMSGRIDLTGNDKLAKLAYSSLYYILSSLPVVDTPNFIGLSPGDLAHGSGDQDYMGHVFWDQETWMYPSIQMLHDHIGKIIIKTRIRTLDAAKEVAASRAFRGAMFPWESALSGYDVTAMPIYFKFEQHITGDIAFAIRQYLYMTRDLEFLTNERGKEIADDIAEFWSSRVNFNTTKQLYVINDVMPPDEWQTDVNNSVYTNSVAKLSLLLPQFISDLLGTPSNPKYKNIADQMYIPYDKKIMYHPEFEGYVRNTTVKQADAILMKFPLMMDMPQKVSKNDLQYYEKVTPGGPAMTWSMFAVGYLGLNDTDMAAKFFTRQLQNVVAPFNVWTENSDGSGAVNFLTGMGGFLQSLLFGYGGFRMFPDRLALNFTLPPSTNVLNITGVDYMGGSMNFCLSDTTMSILQTKAAQYPLQLKISDDDVYHELVVGQTLTFPNKPSCIIPNFDTYKIGISMVF